MPTVRLLLAADGASLTHRRRRRIFRPPPLDARTRTVSAFREVAALRADAFAARVGFPFFVAIPLSLDDPLRRKLFQAGEGAVPKEEGVDAEVALFDAVANPAWRVLDT
jgi:hypothetical protein